MLLGVHLAYATLHCLLIHVLVDQQTQVTGTNMTSHRLPNNSREVESMPIFREILCADRKILILLYTPLHTKHLRCLTAQTERNLPIELDQLGLICRGPCTPSHRAAARSPVALPYAVKWSQTLQAQRPVGSLPAVQARQVSTSQHSTAQRSAAQHSTAQHSTAQPSPALCTGCYCHAG